MKGDEYTIGNGPAIFREEYRKRCSGMTCGAYIVMAKSEAGRWHAFDPGGGSHFDSCPDAEIFRPSKSKGEMMDRVFDKLKKKLDEKKAPSLFGEDLDD